MDYLKFGVGGVESAINKTVTIPVTAIARSSAIEKTVIIITTSDANLQK